MIEPFEEFVKKYKFTKKLPGNLGRMSVLFIWNDGEYICKRILELNYSENEWKLPNEIDSERIVKFDGVYNGNGYYYLVMPYKGEKDLFSVIEYIHFNEDILKPYVREMALCIKECHDKGICHLDIKTENFVVICDFPLKLKLIDFEFSKKVDEKMLKVQGTKRFIAPEVNKYKKFSFASDIYSLGCVMYYLMVPGENIIINDFVKMFKRHTFSLEFKVLLMSMCGLDPEKRITIDGVLESMWLNDD
jgi:serine/threonine protein kinase